MGDGWKLVVRVKTTSWSLSLVILLKQPITIRLDNLFLEPQKQILHDKTSTKLDPNVCWSSLLSYWYPSAYFPVGYIWQCRQDQAPFWSMIWVWVWNWSEIISYFYIMFLHSRFHILLHLSLWFHFPSLNCYFSEQFIFSAPDYISDSILYLASLCPHGCAWWHACWKLACLNI